jgi:methionine synthase II (cobalamin-independent)
MNIPTGPIGSIPRPPELIEAIASLGDGNPPLVEGTAMAARMLGS